MSPPAQPDAGPGQTSYEKALEDLPVYKSILRDVDFEVPQWTKEPNGDGVKEYSYGFGFQCDSQPKHSGWAERVHMVPNVRAIHDWSKNIREAYGMADDAEVTLEQYYEYSNDRTAKNNPERTKLYTRGVWWNTDIIVTGAGIDACNGRYVRDPHFQFRGCPIWHHAELGAACPEMGGQRGGSTIIYDVTWGDVRDPNDFHGTKWQIFHQGGVRYVAISGFEDDVENMRPFGKAPSSRWEVYPKDHAGKVSWGGVLTVGPAPTTEAPGYDEVLQTEKANAESGFVPGKSLVQVEDMLHTVNDVALNKYMNATWVFEPFTPQAEPEGGINKFKVFRNGELILKMLRWAKIKPAPDPVMGVDSRPKVMLMKLIGYDPEQKTMAYIMSYSEPRYGAAMRDLLEKAKASKKWDESWGEKFGKGF
eukprot:JP435764.1.p1 GENE.JP435764.1~~JP435764.1.p1  ORF type:complete len:420 (+),score=95.48 JP435764.1:1-1260(+)